MKYKFHNREFKSKKAIQGYIGTIIKDIPLCVDIYPSDKHFDFLMELVNVHRDKAEKIGCGIKCFYFIRDFYSNKQLNIMRTDDTSIDMSYNYDKITKNDKRSDNHSLDNALRNAINNQIQEERRKKTKPFICNICNDNLSQFQIDHIYPFLKIKQEFLQSKPKLEIPYVFDEGIDLSCVFRKEDINFQDEWEKFHKLKATYQILCGPCNSRKGATY